MRHARLGGLAMSRLGLRAMGISVTRSGAKPAVLVYERGQESAAVRQNQSSLIRTAGGGRFQGTGENRDPAQRLDISTPEPLMPAGYQSGRIKYWTAPIAAGRLRIGSDFSNFPLPAREKASQPSATRSPSWPSAPDPPTWKPSSSAATSSNATGSSPATMPRKLSS
jgi:hypothetical protein